MSRKFTLPIALLGGVILGLAELTRSVVQAPKEHRVAAFIQSTTGYWYPGKQWQLGVNGGGMSTLAIVAGAAIHKGVGGYMGVNKALGQARVPVIRL